MTGIDNYKHLPGFATELKDGGLQVRTEVIPPGTDSVLLLGTAVDGPVGEPIAVDNVTAELIFGPATNNLGQPNGSTLVRGFHEAYAAGCQDIRLMRITGKTAKAELTGEAISRQVEQTVEDTLGLMGGNAELTIPLQHAGVLESNVAVYADGYTIPASAYTVSQGAEFTEVVLAADVTSVGADIRVSYTVTVEDEVTTVDLNGFTTVGEDKVATLSEVPVTGTLIVYANGVKLASDQFTVTPASKEIKVHAGAAKRGETLVAAYITAKTESDDLTVSLESVFGGEVYNQIKVEIRDVTNTAGTEVMGKEVVITKPESKKAQAAEKPLVYSSADYPTLGLLVNAINSDLDNNIVRAEVSQDHKNHRVLDLNTAGVFKGGADEITPTKRELYEVLDGVRDGEELVRPGVYHLLENYTVDMIVPLGVFADDKLPGLHQNFATQLAMACAVISHRNSMTVGVIAASSPTNSGLGDVQAHVEKLLLHKNDYFMRDRAGNILRDSDGNNIDLGRFISVVAGPDVIIANRQVGTYSENSAAGYAGYVSTLRPQSAPTNKAVSYARGLRYNFSNAQLDKLTGARYVTLRYKNNGANVAIVDGPTAAQPGSDYRRLTTTRIVKDVTNNLRVICDPYIGEPNELPQRNAMSAAIDKRLAAMKEAGVIMDYEFRVIVSPQQRLIGEAEIELTIVPPQELRRITTIVGLSAGF